MNRQGLTLVEVLVALALIAITFVVLANSQVANLRLTRDAELTSVAMQFANDILEDTSQRVLENFSHYLNCPGAEGCSGEWSKGTFTATHSVQEAGSSYLLSGLIRVDVVVEGPASVSISHYVSCMDTDPPPTIKNPGVCAGGGS
jgi:prepilin-type N-terminal cleavage/methylation domain-containing protein